MRIELKNINFSYIKNNPVLSDLNAVFEEGKISVLLGPSGCGKSTILRCIAQLEQQQKGDILYQDQSFSKFGYKGLGLSYVFQDLALYQGLNVRENIRIALKERSKEVEKSYNQICELLEISDLIEKKVTQLSGGEMQRVAIARSLVLNPKILLMDEPFSSLDYNIKNRITDRFLGIQSKNRITTILVTHNQTEAAELADKVFLMNKGRIVQEGTYEYLYKKPSNSFVAKFLGNQKNNSILINNKETFVRPEDISFNKRTRSDIKIQANFVRKFPDFPQYVYLFQYKNAIVRVLSLNNLEYSIDEDVDLYILNDSIIEF